MYGISQDPDTKDYIMVLQDGCCEKFCKKCGLIGRNLTNWTSGNEKIDNLIQEMQLKISSQNDIIFEWIPYNQLDSIEEINKGDFATVYSTVWKDGPLHYNNYKEEYSRKSDKIVALKFLHNSQNIINELLINEV